jgi:hypothetical protein
MKNNEVDNNQVKCLRCGNTVNGTMKFCSKCGQNLTSMNQQPYMYNQQSANQYNNQYQYGPVQPIQKTPTHVIVIIILIGIVVTIVPALLNIITLPGFFESLFEEIEVISKEEEKILYGEWISVNSSDNSLIIEKNSKFYMYEDFDEKQDNYCSGTHTIKEGVQQGSSVLKAEGDRKLYTMNVCLIQCVEDGSFEIYDTYEKCLDFTLSIDPNKPDDMNVQANGSASYFAVRRLKEYTLD